MAAAAAGSGTPREEEAPGGEAAATQAQAPTSASGARLSRLPLARVKALVKADPDVTLAGQEAIFILARAAELFVETIAKDAYCCAQQGKRKTLQRRDLDNAIEAVDEFAFLEENMNLGICSMLRWIWSDQGRPETWQTKGRNVGEHYFKRQGPMELWLTPNLLCVKDDLKRVLLCSHHPCFETEACTRCLLCKAL